MYDGVMDVTPTQTEPLLLTVDDAARSLRISRSKFYGLMRAGEIPTLMLGGQRRVAFADLQAFVARLRSQAVA